MSEYTISGGQMLTAIEIESVHTNYVALAGFLEPSDVDEELIALLDRIPQTAETCTRAA
ncbi:MAG TPA: hypothetical protein VEZ11_06020 [Thermoanaerobaculia bacterium]|nr:hypothetical protein [Thermoanaerobaculia bacterium]